MLAYLQAAGMPTDADNVRREHVEAYLADLSDQRAPATVSNRFRALRQFWKWAVEEGEVSVDPMVRMKPPTVPEQPVPILNESELKALTPEERRKLKKD